MKQKSWFTYRLIILIKRASFAFCLSLVGYPKEVKT